jgi:hypothetical protein
MIVVPYTATAQGVVVPEMGSLSHEQLVDALANAV